jgi:hypothetical protein
MIIRSFLVGTAAGVALIGVAQAADLPITKAEPVEYVKVCSEFGPGFFYIPGSDTCLKISGEYRADYGYNTASRADRQAGLSSRATSQSSFQGRVELNFDARTQTDYGLLRSYLSIRAGTGNPGQQNWLIGSGFSGSTVYINKAFIQFGGLTAGYAESQYAFYDNYYGDPYMAPYFGFANTNVQLAYTFDFGGGLTATASIEDPANARQGFANGLDNAVTNGGTRAPNFVGKVLYEQSWGKLQLMAAAHQSEALENLTGASGASKWGFAVGAGASINLPVLSGGYIALEGSYADGANAYTGVGNNQFSPAGAPNVYDAYFTTNGGTKLAQSWAITGESAVNLTPNLQAMLFGSYGQYNAPSNILASADGSTNGDFSSYVVGGQLEYTIVKGLTIGAEVSYVGTKSKGATNFTKAVGSGNSLDSVPLQKLKTSSVMGDLHIKRTF